MARYARFSSAADQQHFLIETDARSERSASLDGRALLVIIRFNWQVGLSNIELSLDGTIGQMFLDLKQISLVFVVEHSRRWQLHIRGNKMFEPLFRGGLSFSSHFFCKIFVFDRSKLNFRGHFLVGSAD